MTPDSWPSILRREGTYGRTSNRTGNEGNCGE